MTQVPLTLRLDASLREGLQVVSRMTRTSMNQLINDAVQRYLTEHTPSLVAELEEKLAQLRAIEDVELDATEAIERFAQAEVEHSDPFEGELFDAVPLTDAQREFRQLLLDG